MQMKKWKYVKKTRVILCLEWFYVNAKYFCCQGIGKIHSLYINKEAWLREELRSGSKLEVGEDEDEKLTEMINSVQQSNYITERAKGNLFLKEILNRDEKLKEEVIKISLKTFWFWRCIQNIMGKQMS